MTRNEWIGIGLAAVTFGIVTAVVIVSEKKASASTPSTSTNPAIVMNNAIAANGFRMVDQPIYEAFQATAGLTQDGFPGPETIAALKTALQALGQTLTPNALNPATNQAYPWLPGNYDGTNAPPQSQWCSGSPAGACP